MWNKADKSMYSKSVWKSGDFLKAHLLWQKNPVDISLTINYDDTTYNLLRIIRWKVIEWRQNMCTLAVAACVDVMASGRRCHFVKSLDPAVMFVVNTIFIISVSNSWMFIFHEKRNSYGKIVNSCCPFMVARRVYFTTVCALNLW